MPKFTLLWENPNVSGTFGAQNLGITITGYDELYIETVHGGLWVKVGRGLFGTFSGSSGGVYYLYSRYFDCTGTDIAVGAGQKTKLTDGTNSTTNEAYVPIRVLGVKLRNIQ